MFKRNASAAPSETGVTNASVIISASPCNVKQSVVVADVHDILEEGVADAADGEGNVGKPSEGDGAALVDGESWRQKDTVLPHLRFLLARNTSSKHNHLVAAVLPLSEPGHTPSRYVWEPLI